MKSLFSLSGRTIVFFCAGLALVCAVAAGLFFTFAQNAEPQDPPQSPEVAEARPASFAQVFGRDILWVGNSEPDDQQTIALAALFSDEAKRDPDIVSRAL